MEKFLRKFTTPKMVIHEKANLQFHRCTGAQVFDNKWFAIRDTIGTVLLFTSGGVCFADGLEDVHVFKSGQILAKFKNQAEWKLLDGNAKVSDKFGEVKLLAPDLLAIKRETWEIQRIKTNCKVVFEGFDADTIEAFYCDLSKFWVCAITNEGKTDLIQISEVGDRVERKKIGVQNYAFLPFHRIAVCDKSQKGKFTVERYEDKIAKISLDGDEKFDVYNEVLQLTAEGVTGYISWDNGMSFVKDDYDEWHLIGCLGHEVLAGFYDLRVKKNRIEGHIGQSIVLIEEGDGRSLVFTTADARFIVTQNEKCCEFQKDESYEVFLIQ